MKKCVKCKTEKREDNFYKDKKNIDGLSCLCKECKKVIDRNYRNSNKEKIKDYQQSAHSVYIHIRSQAKARDINFEITEDYYVESLANKPCYYCGEDNTKHWVDRYDNSHIIGYTNANSVPCCQLCNRMKQALDPEVFIKQCKRISRYSVK